MDAPSTSKVAPEPHDDVGSSEAAEGSPTAAEKKEEALNKHKGSFAGSAEALRFNNLMAKGGGSNRSKGGQKRRRSLELEQVVTLIQNAGRTIARGPPMLVRSLNSTKRSLYSDDFQVVDESLLNHLDLDYTEMSTKALEAMVTPESERAKHGTCCRVPFSIEFKAAWDVLILPIGLYFGYMVPLQVAFGSIEIFPSEARAACQFVFAVDVVLSFLTCYTAQSGVLECDFLRVAMRYVCRGFFLDMVACFPYQLYANIDNIDSNVLNPITPTKAVQLFSAFKVFQLIHKTKSAKKHSLAWAASLILNVLFLIHWTSILFFFCTQTPESTWYANQPKENSQDVSVRYLVYYYEALQILFGRGSKFSTRAERVFASVMNSVGLLSQAVFLGEATLLIQKMNARKTKWRLKMADVNDSMNNMHLSKQLKKKIRNYFAFSWRVHGGDHSSNKWQEELSEELYAEVCLSVNQKLIRSLPLFNKSHDTFVLLVVRRLRTELYLPGDYVVRHGEVGKQIFFVVKGVLQAMDENENTLYSTMSAGSYFGEIALLRDDSKRTATVR